MAQAIDDYGGTAYGGRTRHKRKANLQVSMRCLDCNKLRFVLPRELARVAQPHCLACGGALEQIDASRKRQGLKPLSKAVPKPKSPSRRCPACGVKIENNSGFHVHLSIRSECVRYCRVEGDYFQPTIRGLLVHPGTVHLSRLKTAPNSKPWGVIAIDSKGQVVELMRSSRRYECDDFIRGEFGPVELWRPGGTPRLDLRREKLEYMKAQLRKLTGTAS